MIRRTLLSLLALVACARTKAPPRDASRDAPARVDVVVARDATAVRDAPLAPITLGFAGDVTLDEALSARRPLRDVEPWFQGVSSAWVNLESPVAERGVGVAAVKDFVFLAPPEAVGILREAGVDGVSLANNHALDHGVDGLVRTMALLDAGGVRYAGAGADHDAAYRATRVEVEGRGVSVLGFYRMNCDYPWVALRTRAGIASAWRDREGDTVDAVTEAHRRGDLVVVMVHWGTELAPCPDRWQRALARRWIHAGASLVVGSHPHVLQGVERVGDAWVLYSTGNFAFAAARDESAKTAFFEARFEGAASSLRARPARIVDGVPAPVRGRDAREILATLSRRSRGLRFDDEGLAVASTAPGECVWAGL
ncbi:MAG: CapA family protein [Polyangiales bacterium]